LRDRRTLYIRKPSAKPTERLSQNDNAAARIKAAALFGHCRYAWRRFGILVLYWQSCNTHLCPIGEIHRGLAGLGGN
jgi:hypothetical protein